MNHQWIDTDGDCSCLRCDINWTPERVDGSCVDVAVNDAFDAMINEAPDYDAKRERLHRIFAMADAAIESTPVGERISFEAVIVANQIADNEDAFYEDGDLEQHASEVEGAIPGDANNILRAVRAVELPLVRSSLQKAVDNDSGRTGDLCASMPNVPRTNRA